MSDAETESNHRDEHQVTPLELFFDLVFVFAITQVTGLLADDPTWSGVLRGMLVLAALWWAWTVYAWLTSTIDVDEGAVRLVMLSAMAAMFGVALAVPGSFGDNAVLFGVAYLLVRVLHLLLSAIPARDDPDRRGALLRFAPTAILGASLLVVAGFLEGNERIAVWVVAVAIDYLGPAVIGVGQGWQVAPEHFAERHGLFIIIALGESFIAIAVGFRAGFELVTGVIVAAMLGVVAVSALWWLYFDVAAILARRRLMRARALELHRLALHSYSYLHLAMVAGIVLFAFGLETTLAHVDDTLDAVPALGLCAGPALYLLGHIAFLLRTTGHVFRRRTVGATVLLALIPAAVAIPALVALALVSTVCSLIVAYEAIRYREDRLRIRHPETRGPPDTADMRSSPRATEGRMVNEEFKKALEASSEIELTVTGRTSGRKISLPVWFASDRDKVYLVPVTGSDSAWYKNVLKTPTIRLAAAGVHLDAAATPILDAGRVERVLDMFRATYGTRDVEAYYPKKDVAVEVPLA